MATTLERVGFHSSPKEEMPKTVQATRTVALNCTFVSPWSCCQVSLEIECLSVMVEGARAGTMPFLLWASELLSFASQSLDCFLG